LSHLSYGSVSITSIILNDLRQINPEAELFNVTGTDILEKAYMRWINGYLFRKFSGHIVSVWTDSAESSSVQLPERVGSVPVIPLEIPGFPRISSSQIKKDFASGTWPSTLDPKLAKPIARYKLYSAAAACEAALKSR
jgi:nicotinic acid mononucleotide adenylyltransferase